MNENTYNFDDYKIQEVFYQFYTSGKTGIIKVFFPLNIVKTVYFSDGNIVFATSNSEKDKLTNILIKNKKITKEQLNMALKQMDKSISLGRNLVNMGLITHKELVWAVKIQVLSIVYSILMLKEGEYSIIDGYLPEGIIKLPFNTLKILFDSLLLFKDKDWISNQILPEMVFSKTNLFDEYKEKILADSNYEKIYELIDGKKRVSEITEMVDVEDFKVYKLFYALKFLKFIEEKVDDDLPVLEIKDLDDKEDENLYEVRGDDTENIKMVEELIGDDYKKEEDIAVEYEGGVSEHSAFEEDMKIGSESEIKSESEEENEEEMNSIVLDESDFLDEEEKEQDRAESLKETVAEDKQKYLEELQQKLDNESSIEEELEKDNFPLEFEEEKEEDRTMPVSSPYETAKQEVKSDFSVEEMEDSFVVEEEYVASSKKSMGMYVVLILILFVLGAGYLGYDYYMESKTKNKNGYLKPKTSVVDVQKTKDITSEDITLNKIEKKLGAETASQSSSTENPVKEQSNTLMEDINKDADNIKKSELPKEQNNINNNETIGYEAVPVYEDNVETPTQEEKIVQYEEDYTTFVVNAKQTLLTNPGKYTIQLELACQKETLDKAIELLKDKKMIFFIPKRFRGNDCYIVCYGIFETKDEAQVTMETLDSEFFKDNTPLIKLTDRLFRFF